MRCASDGMPRFLAGYWVESVEKETCTSVSASGTWATTLTRHDWHILCDFDGTISTKDVTDALLSALGGDGWARLEEEWNAGHIGSRACMAGQIALLSGDRDAVDAVIDGIPIDPEFKRFAALARALDVPVTIVSDGIDYAIRRLLRKHQVRPLEVLANRLVSSEAGGWALDFPHARPPCDSGNCKCGIASDRRVRAGSLLLIGDGRSDACVASRVDFVFAKDRLLDHCRAAGLPHVAIGGFKDAIARLPDLLAGRIGRPEFHTSPTTQLDQYA